MSDLFEDEEASASRPDRDPWMHFTITADSVAARTRDALDDPPAGTDTRTVQAGTEPDAASLLAGALFRRRRRGDTASFGGDESGPCSLGTSLVNSVLAGVPGRSSAAEGGDRDNPLRLPEIGDTLFGFRLRYPLGRGAFARVFLAEQCDLAGRPVVLKVSAIEGTEPQTLAQLQHTYIVPIYSAHEDPKAGLRAVCMPYFGGASLSAVLQQVWSNEELPVAGEQLVRALTIVQSPPPASFQDGVQIDPTAPATTADAPARVDECSPLAQLSRGSYIQATAWIVAKLAEGLHHAHRRGIFHRDVKPSNVLISVEGEPLLLDFNLAQDEHIDPELATLGGTVAYMAPEHLRALIGRSSALIRQVDQRSDIYSLGMVLAEMLTGQSPFDQSASYSAMPLQIEAMAVERGRLWPSVKERRPDIPWGLESIVQKCLAPDPTQRYQQADQLADDLHRFLDDRPLRYAPELSRVEQARKFIRRHPRLASSGTVAAAAALILFAFGSALSVARDRLGTAQARDRLRTHEQGAIQAHCLVNTVLDLQDHLRQGVAVCEKTIGLYAVPRGMRWEGHPDLARLGADERRKLAEDHRELLMLLAAARVRLAPGDPAVRRQALALLDQAEEIPGLGPSRALWLERADDLDGLGESARAASARRVAERTPATTARDHYALATAYARRGGTRAYTRALAELDEALRLNPRHYWSSVQRGICHLELGEPMLAAADFGQCIGLWPEFAWGYFNRGCVLDRGGRKAEAIADYGAALRRDPKFVPAAINRGLALLELRRYREALADFDRALGLGRRDSSLHAGRGIALEGLKRHAEADAAFATAFAMVAPRPDPARARLCWTYGFSVAGRLPEKARAAFDDVLLQDPRHPQALYGRAMIAATQGRPDAAMAAFDRALEANPGFNEARRYRAVLLARKGDWDHAAQDINWCLDREPTSADTLYAAACVAAIAAKARTTSGPRALDQALDLLRRARERGIEADRARDDPDLDAVRRDPRFRSIVADGAGAEARAKLDSSTR
jgi:eukaryotic-like serine/threonine-protein kinase